MHEAVNTQTATVAVVPLVGEHDLIGYELLKAVLARAAIQAPNVIGRPLALRFSSTPL